ncbi:ATP-binding protein [Paenibacillus sp. CC-CFT747]|nr:ATP-binding protein [Paenibacillus sp. CC-CFT747]
MEVLILLADQNGFILEIFGDPTMKDVIHQLGMREGILLSEQEMGTNAVHLALKQGHPVEVVGEEHFHHKLSLSACCCVPFHFREINNLVGTVGIMNAAADYSVFQLALLENMVDSMERELLLRRNNRNQYLLNHLMINTIKNGVIVTDNFGNITEFNSFAEKITKRRREDAVGNSIFSFEQFGNYLYEVLKNGRHYEDVELVFTISLDRRIICLFDAIPIYDDNRTLIGAYAQLRDITERFELEQQIINSEKFSAIGRLAAGLAHEIRNPLTSIMGFIQLLLERFRDQESERKYLDLVHKELKNVNKLVSDFVVMAKPSTPDRRECILQELILDTVNLMKSQAILNDTQLIPELRPFPVKVFVDPIQIKQVFVNVIQNALDAMPRGGTITVQVKDYQDKVKISITDTGIGMTEEERNKVLNPFFSTKENGLGLGLSVCYRIVENHKGMMIIHSQKGVGTRFDIILPICEDC